MKTQTTKQLNPQNNELIPLANANAFQTKSNGVKSKWFIRENITGQELFKLDKNFTESQIFNILDFARAFELEAFNKGIFFEKEKAAKMLEKIQKDFNAKVQAARQENERLSIKLMDLIGE